MVVFNLIKMFSNYYTLYFCFFTKMAQNGDFSLFLYELARDRTRIEKIVNLSITETSNKKKNSALGSRGHDSYHIGNQSLYFH